MDTSSRFRGMCILNERATKALYPSFPACSSPKGPNTLRNRWHISKFGGVFHPLPQDMFQQKELVRKVSPLLSGTCLASTTVHLGRAHMCHRLLSIESRGRTRQKSSEAIRVTSIV